MTEKLYEHRILLVDDNEDLCRMVTDMLKREGFALVDSVNSCKEALKWVYGKKVELILLDVNLPDGDGFSLMPQIREISAAPVLFLSARDEDEDRLTGLGLGADDYLTKPFLMKELFFRVKAVLRRTYCSMNGGETDRNRLLLGNRCVDFEGAVVTEGNNEMALTAKELTILKKLYENRGNIVTFDALCGTVWGDSYYGYENTLMVHMRRLREKIEENPSKPQWLLTVRGLGYKMAR